MEKRPFVTREKLEEIAAQIPTPFHIYDEKGLRENALAVQKAFSWNPGFREYFAVIETEYIKAVYCHPAYLTYKQSTS